MKNLQVKVKCPGCGSIIQMKSKSVRTDVFYCPVCETGVIESPDISMLIDIQKFRMPVRQPVLAKI